MADQSPPAFDATSHLRSPAQLLAIRLYSAATQPYRRWIAARQRSQNKSRLMIFFYHHVATGAGGPWTTSPDVFREHIRWLKSRYEMISLAEVQKRMREGNTKPAVHITFDDGYADNCAEALPLLISERVPATYFVTTNNILNGTPFEHDLRRNQPLPVNTPRQIRAMADAGIEIGAHTRTHVDLSMIDDKSVLYDEIVGSKHDLEAMIDRPVRYFAFPYGLPQMLTPQAMRIAQDAGFEAVVSAYGGYNFPGGDSFHLQRIHGDNDLVRFKNWATMDPRKVSIHFPRKLEDNFDHARQPQPQATI